MLESHNLVIIIRDGWGINPNSRYNAVANAHTPNIDSFLKRYPSTILEAAGTAVGLPPGYQGSSEVGHLNIGAGRVVKQEITRINEAIEKNRFLQVHASRELLTTASRITHRYISWELSRMQASTHIKIISLL